MRVDEAMACGNQVPRHSRFLSGSFNQPSTNSDIELPRWETTFYATHALEPHRRDPMHGPSRKLGRSQRLAWSLYFP